MANAPSATKSPPGADVAVGRAAVLSAPREVRLERKEFPAPGPGYVRVRLEGCGLCGSNLPVWEGRSWFDYPRQAGSPGHEGWGFVDAVGDDAGDLAVGDRVACLSYDAFADYDYAEAASTIRLPASIGDAPFPAEPLACAANVFARCDVRSEHVTAVVGVGFLGALLIQYAKAAGSRVVAVSRRPFALEIARQCGADAAFAADEPNLIERLYEFSGGEGCDRAIECVGSQASLDLAGAVVRIRGRLAIAGYHQDGLRQVNMQQWNWRGLDVINAHERDPKIYADGMRRAVQDAESGTIDASRLYTHQFPLERLAEAFETAEKRPDGFLKALIRMDGAEATP